MGVKKLLEFLRSLNPNICKKFVFSDFKGLSAAIDVAIKTFEYKSRFRTKIVDKMNLFEDDLDLKAETQYMIREYLVLIWNLLKAGIIPISVFDGPAPDLKARTQATRRGRVQNSADKIANLRRIGKLLMKDQSANLEEEDLIFLRDGFPKPISTIGELAARLKTELKGSISVKEEEREQMAAILTKLGLPWIKAPSEAEFLCSQLCIQRKVATVISTDSDCLMYYAPILITKVLYSGGTIVPKPPTGELYLFKDVMKVTGLTPTAFKDFCIMCGTDFNDNSPGVGPDTNFILIKTFGSLKNVIAAREYLIKHMADNNLTEKDISKHDRSLLKINPEIYNYSEVIKFMSTPAEYNEEDLHMKVEANHKRKIMPILEAELEKSLFTKCEVYFDRILEIMETFQKVFGKKEK